MTTPSLPKLSRRRRIALTAISVLAILTYAILQLNVLQLGRWNNSVQVAVQILRHEVQVKGRPNQITLQEETPYRPHTEPQTQKAEFEVTATQTTLDSVPIPTAASTLFTVIATLVKTESTPAPKSTAAALQPAPQPPPIPLKDPEADEFNLYLNARRLVILATHRINELVHLHLHNLHPSKSESQAHTQIPRTLTCGPWWVNPLDIRRFEVMNHNRISEYTDYVLEFVAGSRYENRTFAVIARVNASPPHDVEFLNDAFARVRPPFQNFLFGSKGRLAELHRCLTPDMLNSSELTEKEKAQLEDLCSCDLVSAIQAREDSGLDVLTSWPPNSSFLVGEHMNFHDYPSMFNILPANWSRSQPQHCGDSIQMLVMVSSAPKHVEHRRAIRDTYGSKENLRQHSAGLVFLFGRVRDEEVQVQVGLEEEADEYGDIIQANFMDSYHNLTLSHLSMYSYVHYTCTGTGSRPGIPSMYNPPAYIYKADDDFLLNLGAALTVAKANPDAELFGCSYCGTPPIRNRAYMTKYYTPRYMYMGDVYPGYLSGVAYMIRGNVLPHFIAAAQTIPIIHMDDAYITGLVPAALSIYPHNSNFFGYGRVELEKPGAGCELHRMACSYVLNQTDMRLQWEARRTFETALASGDGNCTVTLTPEELKLQVVDDEFKKMCRYFT